MGKGRVLVLKADERLDSNNADKFKSEIGEYVRGGGTALILDFTKTEFIDSIGLGALVSVLKLTNNNSAKVALCGLTPQVRQIFELTRLYRLFDIYENSREAEAAIGK